jgi:hypothetical protein
MAMTRIDATLKKAMDSIDQKFDYMEQNEF